MIKNKKKEKNNSWILYLVAILAVSLMFFLVTSYYSDSNLIGRSYYEDYESNEDNYAYQEDYSDNAYQEYDSNYQDYNEYEDSTSYEKSYADKIFNHEFSLIEKTYISAGKAELMQQEVIKLSNLLTSQGFEISFQDLLDGYDNNFEFTALTIDESDMYDKKITLHFSNNEVPYTFNYSGFNTGDVPSIMFISSEVERIKTHAEQGLAMAETYNTIEDFTNKVKYILDVEAGNIQDITMIFSPIFAKQMGFDTTSELKDVLDSTSYVLIRYIPKTPYPSISVDFQVSYYTEYEIIEKFVSSQTLDVILNLD